MICKFCNRNINPEKTQKLENWGVINEFKCPKCYMLLQVEREIFHKQFGWQHIKKIIEENKKYDYR